MQILPPQAANVTEVLMTSIKLYQASFTRLIGLGILVALFSHGFNLLIENSIPADATPDDEAQLMALALQALPLFIAYFFIDTLLYCVICSAIIVRIDNQVYERNDSIMEVLTLAAKKFPVIMVAAVLYMLATGLGTVLFLVPGLTLMVSLAFCGYFIMLEDMNSYASLKASHNLVWGEWWRTNMVFAVPCTVLLVLVFVLGFFDVESSSSLAVDIFADLLMAVVTPYFYVLGYVQYHDLKLRKSVNTGMER